MPARCSTSWRNTFLSPLDNSNTQREARSAEGIPSPPRRRPRAQPTPDDLRRGVREGNRALLARAVTLIESSAPAHLEQAQTLLAELLPETGGALRVGVTGVPGAGKSTLIEALGLHLVRQGHRVAVLAIDPSSTVSGGSILGDKTRMVRLAREPKAFIRPSPNGGTLGGVARKSRETMLLCEAAGFDVILVETVGVGQSEVAIRGMTDFFLFLAIAGAGDELQGIKKGVLELADLVAVNKADGENLNRARLAKAEYNRILHLLAPATEGWKTKACLVSALTGNGIDELWKRILAFREVTMGSGVFDQRRREQQVAWFRSSVEAAALEAFYGQSGRRERLRELEKLVGDGVIPVRTAVRHAFDR